MQALSASPVGTWRVNAPGDAWWSAEMYEMFGVDPSQGVPPPETVFYLYHPDDTNLVGRAFKKTFTTDEPASVRYRVVRSDGRIRHVWQWGRRQPPDEKGEQCVVGVCVDITGEVVDSDGFETERAFRFVTEHSQDMVIRSQPDGVISYCSPASRSVVGYRPEELIGRTVMDFVAPEELERLNGIIQDRITRKKLVSRNGVEFRGLRKDGEPVWLESNPRLVLNGGGTLTEIVDVVRDVTARKTVEAELKAAREEALVAVAAKSEFIANMSHELRTPLTSILGFASLIGRDGGLTETDKGHLDLVRSAGETLLAVVNDILDFSRLEADAVTLCEAPFSVRELIEHTATLLHAQADKRGLFLDCRIDDDCWLIGDAPRLRQVMNNLLAMQ